MRPVALVPAGRIAPAVWTAARALAALVALAGVAARAQTPGDGEKAAAIELDPDAPAVVLEDDATWTVVTPPAYRWTDRRRVLVRDRRGFDEADRSFEYDAGRTKVVKLSARTVRPDGRVVEVPQDLVRDALLYRDEDHEYRQLRFTFPGVVAGAVLEWEIDVEERKDFPWPWWEIQRDIPVLSARLTVKMRRSPLGTTEVKGFARSAIAPYCDAPRFDSVDADDVTTFSCRRLPAARGEIGAPPGRDTRARMMVVMDYIDPESNVRDWWGGFTLDFVARIERFESRRSETRKAAAALFPRGSPKTGRIDRVLDFLRERVAVRGDSWDLDRHGTTEAAADVDEVLARGGGSPIEVTLLAKALLEAAGLESWLVLSGDRSVEKFLPDLPDLGQGRYFLLQVQDGPTLRIVDPACTWCPRGFVDWRRCGGANAGIRMDPRKNSIFADIPQAPAADSVESREERIAVVRGAAARVQGSARWTGYLEQERREAWGEMTEQARAFDLLGRFGIEPDQGEAAISDASDLGVPLTARYTAARTDLALDLGDRIVLVPPGLAGDDLEAAGEESRRTPLWWAFPHQIRTRATFTLPSGCAPPAAAPPDVLHGPGVTLESAWRPGPSSNEIVWSGTLAVEAARQPADRSADFRAFSDAARRALARPLVAPCPAAETGSP